MERYINIMINEVNNSRDLYLNCYSPMNRHLIKHPILVKMGDKLFIGNLQGDVLLNVEEFEDIKVTRKDGYGGNFH